MFFVHGFEDAYAMIFSSEDVETKRVDQKDVLIETLGIQMD